MPTFETLCAQIKAVLVDVLELDLSPEDIRDDDPLFSHGMGVDSAEALEIVTAVEARFGVRIHEDQIGLAMFQDVASIAEVVEAALASAQGMAVVP
jgi:acyl carrier protein